MSCTCYQTTSLRVLSHNHILYLVSCALQHLLVLKPLCANCLLVSENMGPVSGCMHEGDKPCHGAENVWARSKQAAKTWRWLEWSLSHTEPKWHNDEININTVASLKRCGKRQQSPSCFSVVCALTACNNVLLTYTKSCWEHTLFNRLLSAQVRCQRILCTTSWYTVAQSQAQLGDEGSHSYQDWEQTVTLVLLPDRGAYCARHLSSEKHFTQNIRNKFAVGEHVV